MRLVGDDEVGPALRRLDEREVHGSDGPVVLLAHRLERPPALLHVAAHPPEHTDVGVGVKSYGTNVVVPDKGNELLGYELLRQNTGTISRGEVGGIEVSTLVLDDSGREVRVGDRLLPVEAQSYDLQFFPHPPRQQLEYGRARILAVADMLSNGGPRDVIALSVGSRDGVDNGTVFSTWRIGSMPPDRVAHGWDRSEDTYGRNSRVRLPDEFAGHAMVFRTFDKVSYALVMDSIRPTRIGYELKHPDAPY